MVCNTLPNCISIYCHGVQTAMSYIMKGIVHTHKHVHTHTTANPHVCICTGTNNACVHHSHTHYMNMHTYLHPNALFMLCNFIKIATANSYTSLYSFCCLRDTTLDHTTSSVPPTPNVYLPVSDMTSVQFTCMSGGHLITFIMYMHVSHYDIYFSIS